MTAIKYLICAVFCISGLIHPCEPGVLQKTLGGAVNLIGNTVNVFTKCPAPKRGRCPNKDITYFLYTRETQESPYQLDPADVETVRSAKFIPGAPLKVIIHGYAGWKDYSPNTQLRPAFFQHGEYNIISIDWSVLSPEPCYLQAVENVIVVAECAAQFLDSLFEVRSDLSLPNTHILGYSLGAHVAGLMANSLKTGKAPRVTGFDPASPLFNDFLRARKDMLNPEVAQFVDVYHSNTAYKGKKEPLGHIDIYLNNGASQPGCDCNSTCDHLRSVELFAEALNSPNTLWGFRCKNWKDYKKGLCQVKSTDDLVNISEDSILTQAHGSYWSFTRETSPYLLPSSIYVDNSDYGKTVDVSCKY